MLVHGTRVLGTFAWVGVLLGVWMLERGGRGGVVEITWNQMIQVITPMG